MADIKKFLDQQGVSTLWSKIAEKVAAEESRAKAAEEAAADAAEAAQAAAEAAIQDVANNANNGLILSKSPDNKVSVDWDSDVVFVFNCGSATELVD